MFKRFFAFLCLMFVILLGCSGVVYGAELGVWFCPEYADDLPVEAEWFCASNPEQDVGFEFPVGSNVILNWLSVHLPWDNPFVTEADLLGVEADLISVDVESFWGIIFIAEEHNRDCIDFESSVNCTWFGENLLSESLWNGGTHDEWLDEMYLRMVRGFCNYFHGEGLAVGNTLGYPSFQVRTYVDYLDYYYGHPAFEFMQVNYDFMVFYAYTTNLSKVGDIHCFDLTDGEADVRTYFSDIASCFGSQIKFWILTQIWDLGDNPASNVDDWELEALALEVKNCLDQDMVLMYGYDADPELSYMWSFVLDAVVLYDADAYYVEDYVSGTNLLTGKVGSVYGWIEVGSSNSSVGVVGSVLSGGAEWFGELLGNGPVVAGLFVVGFCVVFFRKVRELVSGD